MISSAKGDTGLPPESAPWARDIEDRLSAVVATSEILREQVGGVASVVAGSIAEDRVPALSERVSEAVDAAKAAMDFSEYTKRSFGVLTDTFKSLIVNGYFDEIPEPPVEIHVEDVTQIPEDVIDAIPESTSTEESVSSSLMTQGSDSVIDATPEVPDQLETREPTPAVINPGDIPTLPPVPGWFNIRSEMLFQTDSTGGVNGSSIAVITFAGATWIGIENEAVFDPNAPIPGNTDNLWSREDRKYRVNIVARAAQPGSSLTVLFGDTTGMTHELTTEWGSFQEEFMGETVFPSWEDTAHFGLGFTGPDGGTVYIDSVEVMDVTQFSAPTKMAQDAQRIAEEGKTALNKLDTTVGDLGSKVTKAADDIRSMSGTITSVGGKYTVGTANPTTNDAKDKPEGAVWEVRSGGTALRRFVLSGGKWVPFTTGTDFIGANSIGSAQISELDAGIIKSGYLASSRIAAQSIMAEKLVIGTPGNLIPNGAGEFRAVGGWTPTQAAWDTTDAPAGLEGAFTFPAGTGTIRANEQVEWDVEPGAEYLTEVWVKADKPGSNLYIELKSAANAHGAQNTTIPGVLAGSPNGITNPGIYAVQNYPVPTVWTKLTARTIPNQGVTKLHVGSVYLNHPNGSERQAQVKIAGFRMMRRSGGELLVDGAITAGKIAAESITAQKLAVDEAFIEKLVTTQITAKIIDGGTVITKSVKAGEALINKLVTNELLANKITADMLQVNQAMINKLVANEFWSDKITAKMIASGSIDVEKLNVGSSGDWTKTNGIRFYESSGLTAEFAPFKEVKNPSGKVTQVVDGTSVVYVSEDPKFLSAPSIGIYRGVDGFTGISNSSVMARNASFDYATVDGASVSDSIKNSGATVIAHGTRTNIFRVTATEQVLFNRSFLRRPDRAYMVRFGVLIWGGGASEYLFRVRQASGFSTGTGNTVQFTGRGSGESVAQSWSWVYVIPPDSSLSQAIVMTVSIWGSKASGNDVDVRPGNESFICVEEW